MPDSPSANITRLPPMMKAFQLVRMPPMPPITSSEPAQDVPHSALAASAVAMPLAASAPASSPAATLMLIAAYQATANSTDITSRTPMRRGGRSISSAD